MAKTTKHRVVFLLLLFVALSLQAGIPGYYFQELLYDFAGADSHRVNSLRLDGSDGGNQNRPYGMLLDPEGKRWVAFYSGYSREYAVSESKVRQLTGLRCFLPDGSEANFSPIEFLNFPDSTRDTLYIGSAYNGNARGLSLDEDGNILYTARSTLYKIDYRNGRGLAHWHPGRDDKPVRTYVKAAHDPLRGHIYLASYPRQESVYILNEDLELLDTAITRTPTLQNAILVRTKTNGVTQLLSATHADGQGIFVYESADPGTQPFVLADTIGNYFELTDSNRIDYIAWASALDWLDREAGIIIFGNDYRALTTVSSGTPPPSPHASRWFIWDVDRDSMIAMFGAPWYELSSGMPVPKNVSASVPQQYLANQAMVMRPSGALPFQSGGSEGIMITDMELGCVQTLKWSQTAVRGNGMIPFDLRLEQNYPNPFNPSTCIAFRLPQPGNVRLSILNLSGKKVMDIFEGYLGDGDHEIEFHADALASGVYLYNLQYGDISLSRKMSLLK